MRLLGKGAWEKFERNGRLFENLTYYLIQREYPEYEFSYTSNSHDHGRDFTAEIPTSTPAMQPFRLKATNAANGNMEKWWAESKSKGVTTKQDKTLSLNDFSTTMYMAYFERVNRVIVFSYSPFNREFWRFLNPCNDNRRPLVIGYSGNVLDELILKHIKPGSADFMFFFGGYQVDGLAAPHKFPVKAFFRRRTKERGFDPEYGERPYCLGEMIDTDLCVVNKSDEDQSVSVKLKQNKKCKMEPLNGFDKHGLLSWVVPAHSSLSCTIRFRIVDFEKRMLLPEVEYASKSQTKCCGIGGSVECTWLADAPLIGSGYFKALKAFEPMMRGDRIVCLSVTGKSGTGKSRLLDEFECKNRCRFDLVCSMDADKKDTSANTAVKQLVSQLEDLPLFELNAEKLLVNEEDLDDRLRFVWDILYDSSFDVARNIEGLANYLIDAMSNLRTLIVLDNVQNYDAPFIRLLDSLLDKIKNQKSGSALVLSFNSDTVGFNKEAAVLMKRIGYLASRSSSQFSQREIKGFSKDDAIAYLETCLMGGRSRTQKIQYDYTESYRFIVGKWGTNPYCLKQLLICMYYDGAIELGEAANFYIADVDKFHESLKHLPSELIDLLRLRTKQVVDALEGEGCDIAEFYSLMALLAFVKTLPIELYRSIFHDPKLLSIVELAGLVVRDDDNVMSFTHQHFALFFKNELDYQDRIPYSRFVRACENLGYTDRYYTHYFIARSISEDRSLEYEAVQKAMLFTMLNRIEPEWCMEFFTPLIRGIHTFSNLISNAQYLRVFDKMVGTATSSAGLDAQCEIGKVVVDAFLLGSRTFSAQDLAGVFKVVSEYLRGISSLARQAEAIETSSLLLETLDAKYGSCPEADRCRTSIADCRAITYFKLNDLQNGLYCANEFHRFAARLHDKVLETKGFMLKGDAYYYCDPAGENRSNLCEQWQKAFSLYTGTWGEDEDSGFESAVKINAYMKGVLADLIMGAPTRAGRKVRFVDNCIGKTHMAYFEIRTRLIVAAYLIGSGSAEQESRIFRLIEEAADKCVVYRNPNTYATCFCLRGIAYLALGQKDKASGCFGESLGLVRKSIGENKRGSGWDHYLASLLVANALGEIDLNDPRMAIPEGPDGLKVLSALNADASTLEDVERELDRLTVWRCPGKHVSFPKM